MLHSASSGDVGGPLFSAPFHAEQFPGRTCQGCDEKGQGHASGLEGSETRGEEDGGHPQRNPQSQHDDPPAGKTAGCGTGTQGDHGDEDDRQDDPGQGGEQEGGVGETGSLPGGCRDGIEGAAGADPEEAEPAEGETGHRMLQLGGPVEQVLGILGAGLGSRVRGGVGSGAHDDNLPRVGEKVLSIVES